MQIHRGNSSEEMTEQQSDTKTKTCGIINKISVGIKSFYYKHFPTDRNSYNLRIPFVGLILSGFSMYLLSVTYDFQEQTFIQYLYIFLAAFLAYGLYYGLKIEDRKQFTPWIIFKLVEMVSIFSTEVYIFAAYQRRWHFMLAEIICGIILLVLNGILLRVVTSNSTIKNQLVGGRPPREVNSVIENTKDNI